MVDEDKLISSIQKIYLKINIFFAMWKPDDIFMDFKQEIIKNMDAGKFTPEYMSEAWFEYVLQKTADSSLIPFFHACVYCIQAERAAAQGEVKQGRSLLCKAIVRLRVESIESVNKAAQSFINKRTKIAASGGVGRSKKLEGAKNEYTRLLKEMCLLGNWKKTEAIKKIMPLLLVYIKSNAIFLEEDNLPNTLSNWSRTEPEIASIFVTIKKNRLSIINKARE